MRSAFLALWFAAAASAAPAGGYHLLKKIPAPGDGGFDYLTVDEGGTFTVLVVGR